MTPEQFEEIKALLANQHSAVMSVLGDMNAGIAIIAAELVKAGQQNASELDEGEEEETADLYMIREQQDGSLVIMFYTSQPKRDVCIGKAYPEVQHLIPEGARQSIDFNAPHWTEMNTPTKDFATRYNYIRPMNGRLTYVRAERKESKKAMKAKPIVRFVAWTPNHPQETNSEPPAPKHRQSTPTAQPTMKDALVELSAPTKLLYAKVKAALALTNDQRIKQAVEYVVDIYTSAPNNTAFPDKEHRYTLAELTEPQINSLAVHVGEHPDFYRRKWQSFTTVAGG